MKGKQSVICSVKKKSKAQSASLELRVLITLSVILVGVFLALFAGANPSTDRELRNASAASSALPPAKVTVRSFMRVTPEGVVRDYNLVESKTEAVAASMPERHVLAPLGSTLWSVDDTNAIADGVTIDANNVWGAWILNGARLSVYPITGNGTPAWNFSSFVSGNSGVAASKGADRMGFMESNAAGNDFRQHGLRSTSNGTPD